MDFVIIKTIDDSGWVRLKRVKESYHPIRPVCGFIASLTSQNEIRETGEKLIFFH